MKSPDPDRFESDLSKEMVKSELSRVNLIAVLSSILTVYLLVMALFFPDLQRRLLGPMEDQRVRFLPALAMALLIVYTLVLRVVLRRKIAAGRQSSTAYRYGTATFEAIYPTTLVFSLSFAMDPVYLLVSAIVLLYTVFIFSTTLQMDPKIPVFSSLLAGAGYLSAYFWFHGRITPEDYQVWLLAPSGYVSRALLLVLSGLLSSFLAGQIRKRVLNLFMSAEEKSRIKQTFGQHVSPQVVDRLLKQRTRLASEMRHVCIMFLDIRNFTTFSENRKPEEVVDILNQHFTFMIDITNRRDGIINKFLGDGFMAVFGAPFSGGEDCVNAVTAAREILDRLHAENRATGRDMAVGIGLHAGEALTGDVGSVERKEYTVMGDVVNVASRIEQLNKAHDTQVLLSEEVYNHLPAEMRDCTDLGPVKVKGREQEIRIFKMA